VVVVPKSVVGMDGVDGWETDERRKLRCRRHSKKIVGMCRDSWWRYLPRTKVGRTENEKGYEPNRIQSRRFFIHFKMKRRGGYGRTASASHASQSKHSHNFILEGWG
jgi:hypothetical protein